VHKLSHEAKMGPLLFPRGSLNAVSNSCTFSALSSSWIAHVVLEHKLSPEAKMGSEDSPLLFPHGSLNAVSNSCTFLLSVPAGSPMLCWIICKQAWISQANFSSSSLPSLQPVLQVSLAYQTEDFQCKPLETALPLCLYLLTFPERLWRQDTVFCQRFSNGLNQNYCFDLLVQLYCGTATVQCCCTAVLERYHL